MKSLAVRVSGGCKWSRVGIHMGHEFLHVCVNSMIRIDSLKSRMLVYHPPKLLIYMSQQPTIYI